MEWHSDEDLRKLEEALMALPEENDPMLLPEFDGFCAGLISCPEMIPPSVWLAKVWGEGGAPEFESLADMQATLDLLMAHYNRVATALMMPGEYFPVMDEDQRNGDILWEFWMLGFLAAMQLRPEAWGKIAASRNVRAIKALKKIEELGRLASRFAEGGLYKANKLATDAPALIPELVEELNFFTKAQVTGLPAGFPMAANMASAPGPKVGRNDPCPCGSRKKFKKCCGAGGPAL